MSEVNGLEETTSEVAEALIAHAGRVKDMRSRSALIAASRAVDRELVHRLRLERELEAARKDALDSFRLGVLAVVMTLDACGDEVERERALTAFREMEREQGEALVLVEETAHVWTDPDDGSLVVWGARPPASARLHRRQVTPWVLVESEERGEREVRPPEEALRPPAVQPGGVLRSESGGGGGGGGG